MKPSALLAPTLAFLSGLVPPGAAQVVVAPWALATPVNAPAGNVIACAGNGFGLAFGHCVLLKSISHVRESNNPFTNSSCLREVTATTTITVGPCPTTVEFTCNLVGEMQLQHAAPIGNDAWASTSVTLDGLGLMHCSPLPINMGAVQGVRPIATANVKTLCLLPGKYVVKASLRTGAFMTPHILGGHDAVSDFQTFGGLTVCINDLGNWYENFLWGDDFENRGVPGSPAGTYVSGPVGTFGNSSGGVQSSTNGGWDSWYRNPGADGGIASIFNGQPALGTRSLETSGPGVSGSGCDMVQEFAVASSVSGNPGAYNQQPPFGVGVLPQSGIWTLRAMTYIPSSLPTGSSSAYFIVNDVLNNATAGPSPVGHAGSVQPLHGPGSRRPKSSGVGGRAHRL